VMKLMSVGRGLPRLPHSQGAAARRGLHKTALAAGVLVALAAAALPRAQAAYLPPEGTRTPAVHRVPIYDDDDAAIKQDAKDAPPFSERATCNQCHKYSEILKGWHFNAADPKVDPGRPGEPWILTDIQTGTQLPMSYRHITYKTWPGTWHPASVGLSPWQFIQLFGRQFPGGGIAEKDAEDVQDAKARWTISGKLAIGCLNCHAADRFQDGTAWATACENQNFMWASTAASGFGIVTGSVKSLPSNYDPLNPEASMLDKDTAKPPAIKYDKARFDADNKVFFDVLRKGTNARCYFCHTTRSVGPDAPEAFEVDEDVHVKAGLACADCHRNGLDHQLVRGYEGEPQDPKHPERLSLTCRGCHLGAESAVAGPETMGGRLGAPVPKHKGLPTIHFEKLTCTACHSGPMPGAQAVRTQTSMAHGLGVHAKDRSADALPWIEATVFTPQADGKIGPNKMMWPAFWGRSTDQTGLSITPLLPAVVSKAAGALLAVDRSDKSKPPVYATLDAETVAAVLEKLGDEGGLPVYVVSGKVYRRGDGGKLVAYDAPPARPYAWPIAHDVRPAARSLGSGGCTDCHSDKSAIFFGKVLAEGPAKVAEPTALAMYEFQGKDPTSLKLWALSYQGRPYFKILGYATAGIIGAVLLLYGFLGLAALTRWAREKIA